MQPPDARWEPHWPTDLALLGRAVKAARKGRAGRPRWSHVAEVFAVGSTVAHHLCARAGLDPDEIVRG